MLSYKLGITNSLQSLEVEGVDMRSIWTRVRDLEEGTRADPASIQESGGGEGQVPAQSAVPSQDVKPIDQIKTEPADVNAPEAKPEPVTESKTAEPPASNPEQVPEAEIKVEVQTSVEVKTNDEAKTEVESKTEVVREAKDLAAEVKDDKFSNGDAGSSSDWQQRELALLKKIQELEKVKNERSEEGLKMELKVREEEIDLLKARVRNLETELQAALSKPGSKNHEMIENIKQQHEELLSKARGMIFDKTKMVKNQELQIEALTTQVQSLKDINQITKDLLEIRNSEIKAMEDRLHAMEERFKTEKERYGLVLQRAQTSSNINDDLKKEYEMQLKIFKELRTKYEQKVEALVAENNKLKLDLARGGGASAGGASGTSEPK